MSFQRRVGNGADRNRGSLPIHQIGSDDLLVRILVPLPVGEALWIAWNLKRGLRVIGQTCDHASVRIESLTNAATNWHMLSADAVYDARGIVAIDTNSFPPIDKKQQLGIDHLRFEVVDEGGAVLRQVTVVIGTPSLYAQVTGLPAPVPSTADDAYKGWRLP